MGLCAVDLAIMGEVGSDGTNVLVAIEGTIDGCKVGATRGNAMVGLPTTCSPAGACAIVASVSRESFETLYAGCHSVTLACIGSFLWKSKRRKEDETVQCSNASCV